MTRKGFTLIELLCGIAVVAVLAALLLPVLARATERARGARRMSDMRQVAVALSLYIEDGGRPCLAPHPEIDRSLDPYTGGQTAALMRRGNPREQLTYYLHPHPSQARPRSTGVFDGRHGPLTGYDVPIGGGSPRHWRGKP